MRYVLQTNSLTKKYKNFQALNGLTMNVPEGSVYGFVGKNGAGKTTLIRLICGLQEPSSGDFTLYGIQSGSRDMSRARRRMGAVVETPAGYMDMTAEEMKQRLGIAIALAGDPDLLVLDEPVNGLDPQGIVEIRELILKLNRERRITVLISSHILDELSRLATHYGIIDHGRMVKELSAEELDAACRKCIRMEVSDTGILARVLDSMHLEYRITSETTADLFAKPSVTQLAVSLAEEGCEVLSMTEKDESLESYYLSLIGGGSHD